MVLFYFYYLFILTFLLLLLIDYVRDGEKKYFYDISKIKPNSTRKKEEERRKKLNDKHLTLPNIVEYEVIKNITIRYDPNTLIAVLSSTHYFKKRYSFRHISRKYCNAKRNCMFIFFIGYSDYSSTILLKQELKLYNDIVQFSFYNSYFNLTLLSIMALKYCFRRFKKLEYYIKTDDDIVINYITLFDTLKIMNKYDYNVYGHYNRRFKVNRNNESDLFIPYQEYPYQYCPEYVYGGLIIMTFSALSKIYNLTLYKNNYVWKEDVNLGILCKKGNITVLCFPNKLNIRLRSKKCRINKNIIATEIYNKFDRFYCINSNEK